MKFRKRPVIIEAVRIDQLFTDEVDAWPEWAGKAFLEDLLNFNDKTVDVWTSEGRMSGARTDWLIRGVKGELYPCNPDIFEMTYEPVMEGE